MSSIDKLKKILSKSTSVNGDVKIAKELVELDERLEEVENLVKEKDKITIKIIEELKGENGKDGYTPRKHIDYFDGEDGLPGRNGKDGKDGKDGRDGMDADYDIILEQILKEVPKYELVGKEVVDVINELPIEKEYQIDAKHIKNLPSQQTQIFGGRLSITDMIVSGTNVSITGSGMTSDPYVINANDTDTGITSLNGLTALSQTFAVGTDGTDFNIDSDTDTHTFNIPTASAVNRGALSSADFTTFTNKAQAGDNVSIFVNDAGYITSIAGAVTSVTASLPLSSSGGATPNITISQAGVATDGYLSSTNFNIFLGKENAITAGTSAQYWRGDKTFQTLDTLAVPENTNLYFTEPRVRSTLLTGLNVTGTTIVGTDTVLEAFGKTQNQINALIGGVMYMGTWNASTNTPTLASGVGTKGHYYVVSVAGSTNLDGITDWKLGDWAIYNGTAWGKVDNTDAVISVNSAVGAVSLTGTANRITVTGTVWDIASNYVGQNSITTLGTITTGVWNGTAIANANLANSSLTIGSTNITLGATKTTLAGLTSVDSTSFVGALTGNASTATLASTVASANEASDTTCFPLFITASGTQTLATKNNAGFIYNSSTNSLTATTFIGALTGNASTATNVAVGGITGLGTGVGAALAVNVGSNGAFVTFNGALGTPSAGTVTNLTGTASININGTVGATTPTTATFTTATINTSLLPDANDGAYLGQAGTAFSDLFLAEGGVINWDSGDMTLTQAGNMLTIAGGDLTTPNITVSAMTAGSIYFAGTGGLLSQDNAEFFWNNSTNMLGIGNSDPQRKLHVTSSSATSVTILALDNPNTTDANATVQSFRTTTTGVGAAAFTEMGAIRFTNRTHDHATRAADFSIFTALAGTLTEVVTIELGRFGIRQTAPTAILHLRAGTATANTAPLKFTSGTDLTTPETGAVEYDGTLLHFTPTGTVRKNIPTLTIGCSTAKTAAVASVATHTVGGVDASYEVSANVLVTTATSNNFTVTCAYTDEGNTARTLTFSFILSAGGTLTTAIRNADGAVPYAGVPQHIRCKAGSTITIATTGTFTTVVYNVEGKIELLATA